MTFLDRRKFLKHSGLGLLPAFVPLQTWASTDAAKRQKLSSSVRFFGDGEMYEPGDYLDELQKVQASTSIQKDRYGEGGVVEVLEKKLAEITGKEKAIYMPSGTMANQLALAVLSGENSKIFVQDTSHVFRDEADAAQTVFHKRLIALAKGEAFFSFQQLKEAIDNLPEEEVFKTGIGAVSIENPVRRADGKTVPLDEIIKISEYCQNHNIKLHLDGARIFIASGWTGVPVKQYASYFDTIYISLYKYFGASGGAVLCGPKTVIDKMPHLIKVHGGSMYGNWLNAAMALHRMEGFEDRLQNAIKTSDALFKSLNKLPGVRVSPLVGGTNIYALDLTKGIDGKKMQETLKNVFDIRMARPDANNHSMITVNETILYQSPEYILDAFRKSI